MHNLNLTLPLSHVPLTLPSKTSLFRLHLSDKLQFLSKFVSAGHMYYYQSYNTFSSEF